jgi:transposase
MRGRDPKQSSMLCLLSPEDRVPAEHPLRGIKKLVEQALGELSAVFDDMYSEGGRYSIPPERLLKSMVLMALYTVRSERLFCEQLDYNLLFRWFLNMDMVEPSFDHSTFSKNRERLLAHDVSGQFFAAVVAQARAAGLMSNEHFSVDGTLIEAWASMKSFRPKDERDDDDHQTRGGGRTGKQGKSNRWVNFRGEKRSNDTHESKTDPQARLMRKGLGKEARLSFSGHALMENRNCLLVDFRIAEATGTAEREVAATMLDPLTRESLCTLGGDKGYDVRGFVHECRRRGFTPHVAQYGGAPRRRSAIDARTTRHPGYRVSQRIRMRIEEAFGWIKTVGNLRRSRWRGVARTQLAAHLTAATYNLVRISQLVGAT